MKLIEKGFDGMLSEKEIVWHVLDTSKELITFKQNDNIGKRSAMTFGILTGLMIALGKGEEFANTDNWLGFVNNIVPEIMENQEGSQSYESK